MHHLDNDIQMWLLAIFIACCLFVGAAWLLALTLSSRREGSQLKGSQLPRDATRALVTGLATDQRLLRVPRSVAADINNFIGDNDLHTAQELNRITTQAWKRAWASFHKDCLLPVALTGSFSAQVLMGQHRHPLTFSGHQSLTTQYFDGMTFEQLSKVACAHGMKLTILYSEDAINYQQYHSGDVYFGEKNIGEFRGSARLSFSWEDVRPNADRVSKCAHVLHVVIGRIIVAMVMFMIAACVNVIRGTTERELRREEVWLVAFVTVFLVLLGCHPFLAPRTDLWNFE